MTAPTTPHIQPQKASAIRIATAIEGEPPADDQRRDEDALRKVDDQIGDRRQRRQCERRECDQADRKGGSDADEGAEIGNEVEDGGRRRP